MNKNFKAGTQGGFTLIELIVVIVILGILAATALPKFANLGGDARAASLRAAKGALAATSAMVHAQALVANKKAESGETVSMEGLTVTLKYGYPDASTDGTAKQLLAAAGISENDYTVDYTAGLKITPKGASDAAKCSVTYTAATGANVAPVISEPTPANLDCN